MEAKGTKVMPGLKYTKTSEWAKVEGANIRVGLTDFAQHELTDIVFADLPKVGAKTKQGESFTAVESVKAVSDFYAPASGEIIEVNKTLENQPELMNKDPYGIGWLAVIKVADPKELEKLLDDNGYVHYLEHEHKGH
ncbi:MAG: glycine cleavage system protein GcvH [Methanobacteriota archaeon]